MTPVAEQYRNRLEAILDRDAASRNDAAFKAWVLAGASSAPPHVRFLDLGGGKWQVGDGILFDDHPAMKVWWLLARGDAVPIETLSKARTAPESARALLRRRAGRIGKVCPELGAALLRGLSLDDGVFRWVRPPGAPKVATVS